jgi:NAD(P)-dependent dehydrogenase (short-subunit alcohol dehydrogenase family)
MPGPKPTRDQLPSTGGGAETYRAADKLRGKRAIITGGDSGIGAATALLFAREGAVSTIAYLPDEEKDAQDTRRQVEEIGGTCYLVALDLVKKENCKAVVDFALKKMGGIDILFNNAACESILPCPAAAPKLIVVVDQMMCEDIADLSEDQWEHTFNINMHAYFYMAKYSLAHMTSGATIINNASINAYVGRPDLLDYTSTKGAIVSFTRGLSNQYVAKGIRVNAVAPGPGEYP